MGIQDQSGMEQTNEANRRLVRFYGVCLGSLVFVYALLGIRLFAAGNAFGFTDWSLAALRVLFGAAALLVIFYPAWLSLALDRHVDQMGSLFEDQFATRSAVEKIRLIVLVTMVSLLLELVMIRWLASVFPVFSFFKNFTLLACFLGLGTGYAVADKERCAPALVLPMLALFVLVITLLRYDVGAETAFFSALPMQEETSMIWMDQLNWLVMLQHSLLVYLLLGASFILCACICYPIGQLCGKLLGATDPLKAYGLNLAGSILGVMVLFVLSLFWLPPLIWFTAIAGVLLYFVLARDARLPVGVASFCLLLTVLAWQVQTDVQRIYSPYQLIEKMAKPEDGLMNILSGGAYYQKVFNLSEASRGHETDDNRYARAYYEFPFNFKKRPERVAIVGAGSGNDVAAALRMGAAHVDAIEIDPVIVFLGKAYHPEHPYDDPRVSNTI